MKIYSRTDATQISGDPDPYEPDEEGAFDVPEELGTQLIDFHGPDGKLFESGAQRNDRKAAEDLERRKSPEALFEQISQLVAALSPVAPAETPAEVKKREAAEAKEKKEAEAVFIAEQKALAAEAAEKAKAEAAEAEKVAAETKAAEEKAAAAKTAKTPAAK